MNKWEQAAASRDPISILESTLLISKVYIQQYPPIQFKIVQENSSKLQNSKTPSAHKGPGSIDLAWGTSCPGRTSCTMRTASFRPGRTAPDRCCAPSCGHTHQTFHWRRGTPRRFPSTQFLGRRASCNH